LYLLGEAYAFGVVWSFALKAVGVLTLRFQRHDQEYKFPVNLTIAGKEIPIGLAVTTMILLVTAVVNLFSKQYATIYGVAFTVAFFFVFTISERVNQHRNKAVHKNALEEFNLQQQPRIDAKALHARPGCVLVAVRDPANMQHLRRTLQKTDLRRNDIVVMTVRTAPPDSEYSLTKDQLFGSDERALFSSVVSLAEKEGKPVELLVVPSMDPFDGMVRAAQQLKVSRLVTGMSQRMTSDELARRIGLTWENLPEPRHPFSLEIIVPGRPSTFVNLGPHPPRLWPEDVDKLHRLWLQLSAELGSKLHHRDVVGVALHRLERELDGSERDRILSELNEGVSRHS
jgi:hypothetical protein